MLRVASLPLALALLGQACSNNSPPEAPSQPRVPLGQEFELAPGQSARATPDGLVVTFQGVEEDSRCPVDVQCVWEGNALVVVSAERPPVPAATLQLETSARREAAYAGYTIRLVGLSPHPRQGETIPRERYRLRLAVTVR